MAMRLVLQEPVSVSHLYWPRENVNSEAVHSLPSVLYAQSSQNERMIKKFCFPSVRPLGWGKERNLLAELRLSLFITCLPGGVGLYIET
jgi:hypothetical protein